jgi:hypothetical protein
MALIGISGKMQSGKNTIASIIQYLTSDDCSKQCLPRLRGGLDIQGYHNSEWQQKSFAGKLKQIVSILTGIPVEDLEKQEVKDRVLGEEWWYFKVYSDIRQDKFEIVHYKGEEGFYDRKENYKGHSLREPTVRQLLQEIGTGAMRNVIHPNIWVNALFADYKKPIIASMSDSQIEQKIKEGDFSYPNWIITDLRFPNELEAIKQRGGITIRVNRPAINYKNHAGLLQLIEEHPSETSLDYITDWDYVIDNSGSINDLIDKVRDIVKNL